MAGKNSESDVPQDSEDRLFLALRYIAHISSFSRVQLVRIPGAGGGLVVGAGRRTTDKLIKIWAAAKQSGTTLVLRNMAVRKTGALVKITAVGKGKVIFEL
jgi:hypothetical protein